MANLDLKYKINIPFAEKGDRDEIPDTSPDGLVNNTDGLGIKYELEIPAGGEYYERQIFNGVVHKVYAAVKELQDLAILAGFPVDMTKALNILPLANGGTGANNASKARSNLGLGSLATKSTITSADIADNTITATQLAANSVGASELANNAVDTNAIVNGAVTQAKLASSVVGNLPIGFIYFQLRGQSTPDVLFKTTGKWQDISATYAGEFFRAVGGNSAAFGSKQNEGLPNITANWGETYLRQNNNIQPSGAATGTVALAQAFGNSTVTSINSIGFNASYANTIYGSSTHVTPYNSAIRIWKKIS